MRVDLTRAIRLFRGRPSPSDEPDGIVIGEAVDGSDVVWAHPTREVGGHVALTASTGAGKSVLLGAALARRIAEQSALPSDQRPALAIIDPKADTLRAVTDALAVWAPHRLRDIQVLNPFEGGGFPANLCHLALDGAPPDILARLLADLVGTVSTSTGAQKHLGTGARQQQALAAVFAACLTSPSPERNLLWGLDALQHEHGIEALAAQAPSEEIKSAVLSLGRASPELRASTAARVSTAFGYTAQLRRMVSSSTTVQPRDLCAPGAITFIDLSQPPAGSSAQVRFQAALHGRLLLQHALSRRSDGDEPMLTLVFEEAALVADTLSDLWINLLQTGRSRGVSTIYVFQSLKMLGSIADNLLPVILANALFIAGRLGAPDADVISRQLGALPGTEESVSAVRSRVASELTNLRDREFIAFEPGRRRRFRSRDEDLDAWRAASASLRAVIDEVHQRWAAQVRTGERPRLPIPERPTKQRRGTKRAARPPETPAAQQPLPGADAEPPQPSTPWE